MYLKSIFENNKNIPSEYSCDGEGLRPPLEIYDVPPQTASLALIVLDPDAPSGNFCHWTIWNIDPKTTKIDSNNIPDGSIEGLTSLGKPGYVSPCPPSGIHRYIITLYALNSKLELDSNINYQQLQNEINIHLIEKVKLTGLYSR